MKTSTKFLMIAALAGVGYFVYRRYRDNQIASAHPIVIPNPATLIKPLPVDASLVTDTNLAV